MDNEVREHFEALLRKLVPSIQLHAPIAVIRRFPVSNAQNKRIISAVVAVSAAVARDTLMPASGTY
eukprot:14194941-Alexandrium_andersonii.AAC.1